MTCCPDCERFDGDPCCDSFRSPLYAVILAAPVVAAARVWDLFDRIRHR